MSALLVLPDWSLATRDFQRCLESMAVNFPAETVELASLPGWAAKHEQVLATPVGSYDRDKALSQYDLIAFIENASNTEAVAFSQLERKLIFRFDLEHPWFRARMYQVTEPMAEAAYPKINSHIFNRLAPYNTDMYYYFPYGYLFRCLGLGPINEFGFRISEPLSTYVSRPANHKVVVVFGGSSTWSLDCLHTEMFALRLEKRLNHFAEKANLEVKFTVLNMGQHGHLVLNELVSFILFCRDINPDIVIAHDGFNDFLYGMLSDRYLMREGICYQFNHEQFAQILHGSEDRPLVQSEISSLKVVNTPQVVIRAYKKRKNQFQDTVMSQGAQFIWGLQPFIESKPALSPEERKYIEEYDVYNTQFGAPYRNMKFVYDAYVDTLQDTEDMNFINFHKCFEKYGKDDYLCADFCHMTPRGDDLIAKVYCDFISDKIRNGKWFA